MSLDIGPETAKKYAEIIADSKTVFWNGPMGVFEKSNFADGTRAVAQAMIDATANNGSFTVVGGGDSAASVRTLGLDEDGFSHISSSSLKARNSRASQSWNRTKAKGATNNGTHTTYRR